MKVGLRCCGGPIWVTNEGSSTMDRLKILFILLIIVILTFPLAGCGGVLSEKEAIIAAFNADIVDDDTQTPDAMNASWLTGGVHWNILDWNVKLTRRVRGIVIDGNNATLKATFTISGEYQISVNDQERPETKINFSSNEVAVQLEKIGEKWCISDFPDLVMKSNPEAPNISDFKFTPENKEVSPGALISVSAEINCKPQDEGLRHIALHVLTRYLGIEGVTREVKLTESTDFSYHDSMFIQSDAGIGNHYGGVYATELVNTGDKEHPDYKLYITAYLISIKITL